MNKIIKTILLLVFSIFMFSCFSEEERATNLLKKHLKAKYNGDFEIAFIGERGHDNERWYEAEIYMKDETNPSKESDYYYWAKWFVRCENGSLKAGDLLGENNDNNYFEIVKKVSIDMTDVEIVSKEFREWLDIMIELSDFEDDVDTFGYERALQKYEQKKR